MPSLPVSAVARGDQTERRRWTAAAVLGVTALLVAYGPVVGALVALWRHDKYYPYLGLILPLFALMLWMSRGRRPAAAGHWAGAGMAVVAGALVLLAVGRAGASLPLQALSLVVAAVGVAIWLRGPEWVRSVAYPFAFLLLLVPPPRAMFDGVTLDLQRVLTRGAGALLHVLGMPVRMEDIALHLPTVTLEITEACNGLRFLTAFVALSVAAAGLIVSSAAGRALIIALAIPIAVGANVLRITGLGLVAHWIGPEAAQGALHYPVGWAAWALAIMALVALTWLLHRPSPRRQPTAMHVPVSS